jgi:hypothetical protein
MHVVQAPGVGVKYLYRCGLLPTFPHGAIGIGIRKVVIGQCSTERAPNAKVVVLPARQAYAHWASLGSV